jgi:hypothetical protein
MTGALILLAALVGLLLIPVSFVQLLFLESLRLRARDQPALEFFKSTLEDRLGLESERGLLSFALIKHSLLVGLGVIFIAITVPGGGWTLPAVAEALLGAWLTMLAAAVPARRDEMRPLWQEAKELNLIFGAALRTLDRKHRED